MVEEVTDCAYPSGGKALQMLRALYEWTVAPVADLIAYAALFPIFVAPVVVTFATWHCVSGYLKRSGVDDTHPLRPQTYALIGLLCGYVFLVTGTAVIRLPHVYYALLRSGDD